MKNKIDLCFLILLLIVSASSLILIKSFSISEVKRDDNEIMNNAVKLSTKWFSIVTEEKRKRNIISDEGNKIKFSGLLGIEYSNITTTLGDIEAKITSINPYFSALFVKWFIDNDIDSTKTVGLIISGSFPALAITALAALQTLKIKAIVLSSIGASSYGANDSLATWIDMELWLRQKGGLIYFSQIVTYGSDNDNGFGLQEEGIKELEKAAERCKVRIYKPADFSESLELKTNILLNYKINLLINIGGNQIVIGKCNHGILIPNGFNKRIKTCNCDDRGLLFRINDKNIPIIFMLNIKDLAVKNGLPLMPKDEFTEPKEIFQEIKINKLHIIIAILFNLLLILFWKFHKQRKISEVN